MNLADFQNVTDGRNLSGYKKKSFILPFSGGEIWFEHLDGIYQFTDLAIEKLKTDIPKFQRPSSPSLIGFVLNETIINDKLIECISNSLTDTNKKFMRVAFIGSDKKTKKSLLKSLSGKGFALNFFYDFEKAKEWLVMEGI